MLFWPIDSELPPGYPKELEGDFDLSDGRHARIRPILPQDYDDLADAIRQADSETLLHRFFTAAPYLSEKQIHYLSEVDYRRRLAIVAADDEGGGIAVARYECYRDCNVAEVAVAVTPAWRSGGLATEMLRRLEEPARRSGIAALDATYLPENRPIASVFVHLGYSEQRIEDGVAQVSKALV